MYGQPGYGQANYGAQPAYGGPPYGGQLDVEETVTTREEVTTNVKTTTTCEVEHMDAGPRVVTPMSDSDEDPEDSSTDDSEKVPTYRRRVSYEYGSEGQGQVKLGLGAIAVLAIVGVAAFGVWKCTAKDNKNPSPGKPNGNYHSTGMGNHPPNNRPDIQVNFSPAGQDRNKPQKIQQGRNIIGQQRFNQPNPTKPVITGVLNNWGFQQRKCKKNTVNNLWIELYPKAGLSADMLPFSNHPAVLCFNHCQRELKSAGGRGCCQFERNAKDKGKQCGFFGAGIDSIRTKSWSEQVYNKNTEFATGYTAMVSVPRVDPLINYRITTETEIEKIRKKEEQRNRNEKYTDFNPHNPQQQLKQTNTKTTTTTMSKEHTTRLQKIANEIDLTGFN